MGDNKLFWYVGKYDPDKSGVYPVKPFDLGGSGKFGPYVFGMDIADGMETTVVSRVEADGTITVLDITTRAALKEGS